MLPVLISEKNAL